MNSGVNFVCSVKMFDLTGSNFKLKEGSDVYLWFMLQVDCIYIFILQPNFSTNKQIKNC